MRKAWMGALLMVLQANAATVLDITYDSPKGGKVPAFIVSSGKRGPAVVFLHWGLGDRHAFLDEARTLATYGVTSLLIDAPFVRPNAPQNGDDVLQAVADVRAGVDLLSKRDDVDPKRIGFVGMSYGAHVGALLAAQEPRLSALVLAGGLASNADAEKNEKLKETDAEQWIGKPRASAVFLQFAIHDEYISREQATRFIDAASQRTLYKWYEGNHAFNAAAREDRDAWLAAQLDFTIPGSNYKTIIPSQSKLEMAKLGVVFEVPGMQQIPVVRDVEFKPGMKMDVYSPFGLTPRDRVPFIIAVNGQSDNAAFMKAMRGARFATTFAQALAARTNRIVIMPDIRMANEGDPADDLRDIVKYVAAHAAELHANPNSFAIMTRSAGYSYGLRAAEGAKAAVVWYGKLSEAPVLKDVPLLVVTAQYDFFYEAAATEKYVSQTGAKHIHLPDSEHGFELFDDLEQVRDAFLQTAMFLREHLPVR